MKTMAGGRDDSFLVWWFGGDWLQQWFFVMSKK
jgi:hypothetical protein